MDTIVAELSNNHRGPEIVAGCDTLIHKFKQGKDLAEKDEGKKILGTL